MKNDGEKYGDVLYKLAKAERDLSRAFNKWNKLRLKLARLGKKLDRHAFEQVSEEIEGRAHEQ